MKVTDGHLSFFAGDGLTARPHDYSLQKSPAQKRKIFSVGHKQNVRPGYYINAQRHRQMLSIDFNVS